MAGLLGILLKHLDVLESMANPEVCNLYLRLVRLIFSALGLFSNMNEVSVYEARQRTLLVVHM